MGIFLTVALVELILADQSPGLAEFLLVFVKQMGLGLTFGLLGGFLIVRMADGIDLEPGLYPIVVLAASLAVFGGTGAIGGSGFLAAYVAGLHAGNQQIAAKLALLRFQDAFTSVGPDRHVPGAWSAGHAVAISDPCAAGVRHRPLLDLRRASACGLALSPSVQLSAGRDRLHRLGRDTGRGVDRPRTSATGRRHSKWTALLQRRLHHGPRLAASAGLDHPADSEVA